MRLKSWAGQLGHAVVLPTALHCRNIFSIEALSPWHNDTEMGPTNSLHASGLPCNTAASIMKDKIIVDWLK